mgnify:FL=1
MTGNTNIRVAAIFSIFFILLIPTRSLASDFADRMKVLRQRMSTEAPEKITAENPEKTEENNLTQKSDDSKKQIIQKPAGQKNKSKKKTVPPPQKSLLPLKTGWKLENDSAHKYRIQFPADWQAGLLMDGTDRVRTGLSADQNLSVRVRSFDVPAGATTELIKTLFEQHILGGGNLLHSEKGNLCGVPSIMSVYAGQFNNIPVNMVAVVLLRQNRGYIVWAMIPTSLFALRSAEADSVLATFEFTD